MLGSTANGSLTAAAALVLLLVIAGPISAQPFSDGQITRAADPRVLMQEPRRLARAPSVDPYRALPSIVMASFFDAATTKLSFTQGRHEDNPSILAQAITRNPAVMISSKIAVGVAMGRLAGTMRKRGWDGPARIVEVVNILGPAWAGLGNMELVCYRLRRTNR